MYALAFILAVFYNNSMEEQKKKKILIVGNSAKEFALA